MSDKTGDRPPPEEKSTESPASLTREHGKNSAGASRRFQTTHWSVVQAAGDSASPESREALAKLCRIYWSPVYAYIRRCGNDAESSKELTQGFFTRLLDKRVVKEASRERGKFRSFLLASVKNYMSNEQARGQAQKRGGAAATFSVDFQDAESLYGIEPADLRTPEKIFEKRWALSVLERALSRLEDEMQQAGNAERFLRLKPFLIGDVAGTSYKDVSADLEMSESAAKVAVHRLRGRFGDLLREDVSQTLADPLMIDEELRFFFTALGS